MDLAFDQASHNIESQNKSRRDKAKKELEKKRYLEKKKKQLEDKYEEQVNSQSFVSFKQSAITH